MRAAQKPDLLFLKTQCGSMLWGQDPLKFEVRQYQVVFPSSGYTCLRPVANWLAWDVSAPSPHVGPRTNKQERFVCGSRALVWLGNAALPGAREGQ